MSFCMINVHKKKNQMNKVKIFIFTGSFQYGGTERFITQLIQNLNRNKYNVVVGCFKKSGEFMELIPPRTEIHEFVFQKKRPFKAFGQFLRLTRFIKKNRFDLVYATHFQTNIIAGLSTLLAGGAKMIVGYRGLGATRTRVQVLLENLVNLAAHKITANSEVAVSRLLRRNRLVRRDKIEVVYNGIDDTVNGEQGVPIDRGLPEIAEGAILIGSIGRLDALKGHRFLIRAFAKAAGRSRNLHLVLIGDGPERKKLEGLVSALGMEDRVSFLGFRGDVNRLLPLMDLFVLPSLSESFPNVLLEAMIHRVPVIATRVGGVPELIEDGVNGVLVVPEEVNVLTEGISLLAGNRALAHEYASKAYESVTTYFCIEKMIHRLDAVFRASIGDVISHE